MKQSSDLHSPLTFYNIGYKFSIFNTDNTTTKTTTTIANFNSHTTILYRPCVAHEFICSNGQCIPMSVECDGFPDCADYSDETNCSTTGEPMIKNMSALYQIR